MAAVVLLGSLAGAAFGAGTVRERRELLLRGEGAGTGAVFRGQAGERPAHRARAEAGCLHCATRRRAREIRGLWPFTYTFTVYEDRRPSQEPPQADPTVPSAGAAMPLDAFRGPAAEPVAVAGGPIFIPMSLLANAPNEAVFAFQLAHAMAHTALRHQTRWATRAEFMDISTQVAQDMPTGQRGQAIPIGYLAFSRANEREADYLAAQIVSRAGYSPEAMASYVSEQPAPKNPAFSPHPIPSDRAKAIRAELEMLPPDAYTAATGGFADAKALAAAIR